jgi:hypothetical protein
LAEEEFSSASAAPISRDKQAKVQSNRKPPVMRTSWIVQAGL